MTAAALRRATGDPDTVRTLTDICGHLGKSALSAWSVPVLEGYQHWDRGAPVLTVAKVTKTTAGGYAEYLDGKTQAPQLGDYYLKDGERTEAPGRWAGGGELFDLDPTAPVTGEQLRTLMDVRRPDTGHELRRAGGTGEAVSAIDVTFSAPKSVSAAWALARPEVRAQIEAAHETAIDRALVYAVGQVPMLRRRVSHDHVMHEKATGLVATSWRHTTARAVDQQVPDPQLHSHVLLHAAVRKDRKLAAIDSRSWLVHQREVGAAYRTELARELHQLGFTVRRGTGRGGRYFELEEVPQPLLDRWSSRRHQVQAAIARRLTDQERTLAAVIAVGGNEATDARRELTLLHRSGQLSPRQERMAAIQTRTTKTPITTADLDDTWRRTALSLGVSRERIDVLRHQQQPVLASAPPDRVLAALTEFDATFAARDARAVALERSAGAPINDALGQLRQLRASDDILLLADRTGTTRQHRGKERAVVAVTQRLAGARVDPLPAAVTAREADRLDQQLARTGGRLSPEQHAAIELGCGTHPLVVIEGHAGTGKSTALAGIARAHQATGRQIIVTSTTGLAAQRLATDLNQHQVTCRAYSTAALHAAISSGRVQLGPDTTVIHDEAALASTREQLQLLTAVEDAGARLIEIGDPQQNQPVGASGLWTQIHHATHQAGANLQLTRNQRARDPDDRRNQALFRNGEIEQAIRGYHDRDRVHLRPDQQHAEDQALNAAHADRSSGKTTIVIAQTSNDHLDELNARAQAIRRQAGQLGNDSLPIPGRPYELHAGDHVQIRRTIEHPEHGPLRNGATARVAAVDPRSGQLDLALADDTQLTLDRDQIDHADLRLAYVQHPFPAQGQTTDTAHLIVGDLTTREGSYVALTRARDDTHVYAAGSADPEATEQLSERMSHTEPDVPSIQTPLAHEQTITTAHTIQQSRPVRRPVPTTAAPAPDAGHEHPLISAGDGQHALRSDRPASERSRTPTQARSVADVGALEHRDAEHPQIDEAREIANNTVEQPRRAWPRTPDREPAAIERDNTLEHDHSTGWEP